nr:hypothetical protein [Tanacetum cinerariifolium]
MNYLEENTDGEAMINSIQNGDQPLPVIAQVSLAGNAQNAPPTLKDPKFWTAKEKKTQKIDHLARSLLIQGLPNDIYSLIDSNETAKDLWDALERQMRGSKYGEQDRKATILYEYKTFKAIEGEQLVDTYLCYVQVINDLKKCGYKKDNYPLALVAEKTKVSKRKEKVEVQLESEESDDKDISDLKKITALLAKAFNRKNYYDKPTNNNLRTSLASSSANKKPEYVKLVEKKEDKKADEKKRDMSKVKCYNCKKERHFSKDCKKAKVKDYNYYKTKMLLAKKDSNKQVLLAEDQAWMESNSDKSSSSAEEAIAEVTYYTSDSESESEYETSEYYDNSTNYGLFVNDNDDQEIFHDAIESASENFIENHIDSQKDYNKSEVDHNDSEEKEHLVDKLIQKFNHKIAKLNTLEEQNNEFNEQMKVLNEKNADLLAQTKVLKDQLKVKHVVIDTHTECQAHYAKLEEENYEYMIRYSALCDNDKQHRKKIKEQEILFDKMSHKTNQTIHMIMPSKDSLYNSRKGIGFENPSYFEKAKDLRPSLYDEKVIGLGYTLMFLIHSNEALKIKKFKRARENKIEFAYDYGNFNASYQTSSLKPYVLNVILEKIIIDLEDEVVSLLEKEKENLKTIEYLKSKECDNMENPKVISLGMLKLSVSQSVSPISMSKTSFDSKNVKNLDTFSSDRRPKHSGVNWKKKGPSNTSNVDLSFVSLLKLNKNVKRYSRKDLLSCNNSHLGETSCAYVCNDAMNVSCNSRLCDSFDENNLFIFDDESVRISPVSKMPFRKKPRDSMNACSKSNLNKSLPRTVHRWLPKLQPLAEPVAKWIPRIVNIFIWIIDSGCSKHMTDFAVIAGYEDVVIESMTIKKVYYVEGLRHNLFSVGQFCDKGLEVAFQKSTCFVRSEDGVDLLTGDRLSNLYTIAINEVASNSSTCLLAKASSLQSWLWHQRLSHLNFATINNLVKNNHVQGLPKMKFEKDHLCSACEQGKNHRKHHKSKNGFCFKQATLPSSHVIIVIDDYSRYTWVFFLHSKDEASDVIISFIKKTQVNLQLQV